MIRFLVAGMTLWLCGCMVNAQSVPLASRAFTITHYDVELRPQIETRTVEGSVSLTVRVPDAEVAQVTLNRGALEIDEVRGDGRPLTFESIARNSRSMCRPRMASARSPSRITGGPLQVWCLLPSASSSTPSSRQRNGCRRWTHPMRAPLSVFGFTFPGHGLRACRPR